MILARSHSDTVITCAADRSDLGTNVESTLRSRAENHSGWEAKEMSCTVTTSRARDHRGVAYVTCSRSRRSRADLKGSSKARRQIGAPVPRRRNPTRGEAAIQGLPR